MKKMALKPEELCVETFQTSSDEQSRRGTVKAHEDTFFWPCQTGTCKSCDLRCLPSPGGL
jgi:hypothetical protein